MCLLHAQAASLNVLLSGFQQACGFEYTSKLQRMFQDIGVSKDLNEQFKKHLQECAGEPLDSKQICKGFDVQQLCVGVRKTC